MMAALALSGGLPSIRMPESNTRMDDLPEGFREWWFNRDTGELITEKQWAESSKNILVKEEDEIRIFRVISRNKVNAIKEFKRLNPTP